MKIICISGYSGGGKSTMLNIMEKNLPNSFAIRVEEEMLKIFNTKEAENFFGFPANNDNILVYLYKVANLNDLNGERTFFDLSKPYIEKKIIEMINSISFKNQPDFIIIDWIALPLFDIWNQANFRIIVEPADFLEHMKRTISRNNSVPVNRQVVEKRISAFKDVLSCIDNTNYYIVKNYYNEEYELEIKDICIKLVNEYFGGM